MTSSYEEEEKQVKEIRRHVQKCIILGRDWLKSEHKGYNAETISEIFNEEIEAQWQPIDRIKPENEAKDIESCYEYAFSIDRLKNNKALNEGYKLWKEAQDLIYWEPI